MLGLGLGVARPPFQNEQPSRGVVTRQHWRLHIPPPVGTLLKEGRKEEEKCKCVAKYNNYAFPTRAQKCSDRRRKGLARQLSSKAFGYGGAACFSRR